MISKTQLILLTIALCFVKVAFAQYPHFTQWQANYNQLNPAFTGISNNPRINLTYRNQWPDISGGGFLTSVLSYDQRISPKAGYFGVVALNDAAGSAPLITNAFKLQYAYNFSVSEKLNIRVGADVGAFNRTVDFGNLRFGYQITPGGPIDTTHEGIPSSGIGTTGLIANVGLGTVVSYNNLYAGFAVNNLLEPQQSFFNNPYSRLPRRYSINAGGFFPLSKSNAKSVIFAPYVVLQRQAKFTEITPGININKGIFTGGISVRQTDPNTDAVNFLVGISKGWFKGAYSYDYTVSDARSAAKGSHELTLSFYLGKLRDGSDKGLPYYFRKMGF